MPQKAQVTTERHSTWTDTQLVKECLRGSEEAWSALIDMYKNLIFSIPIKYGFSTDDATDIFQAVCVELLFRAPKTAKTEGSAEVDHASGCAQVLPPQATTAKNGGARTR